jgi:hypothetical protein
MNRLFRCLSLAAVVTILSHSYAQAQTANCIGLVLETDSTNGVKMPKIVKVLPEGRAAAEPEIKEGLYVLKVNDTYCRNTPLKSITDIIDGGEEGMPVWLEVSADKDTFPKHHISIRRGKAVGSNQPVAVYK